MPVRVTRIPSLGACLFLVGCTAARGPDDREPANVTWVQLTNPSEASLTGVHFVDADEGWVSGENLTLERTSDGGLNWTKLPFSSGADPASAFHGLHFVDPDSGWVATDGALFRTSDGGQTWNGWQDWGPMQRASFNTVVAFSDSLVWTAGGTDDAKDATHCVSDQGSQRMCPTLWRSHFTAPKSLDVDEFTIQADYAAFKDVFFASADIGYAVGSRGLVFRIGDAQTQGPVELRPKNSGLVPYPNGPSYDAVFMLDERTAWIVGEHGLIFHTSDGETWAEQDSGVKFDLHDIVFVDAQTGWAVGDHGTILSTLDGGDSWERLPMIVDERLSALSFPNQDVGYAAGDHGTILKVERSGTHR